MADHFVKASSAMSAIEDIQTLRETFESNGMRVVDVMMTAFKVYSPVGIFVYSYRHDGIYATEVDK